MCVLAVVCTATISVRQRGETLAENITVVAGTGVFNFGVFCCKLSFDPELKSL